MKKSRVIANFQKGFDLKYRGSLPYANFITAVFQNFPDIWLMLFRGSFYFITVIFGPNRSNEIKSAKKSIS